MITITEMNGFGPAEDGTYTAELECEYGTFAYYNDTLHQLADDDDGDMEPVDWDIVAEDPEQEADFVAISEALQHFLAGYTSVK